MNRFCVGLSALLSLNFAVAADVILVTGQVESRQSQDILAPVTTTHQAKISEFADEGSWVDAGDVVVQFDGSDVDSRILAAEDELMLFNAGIRRDLIRLEIEMRNAELEAQRAQVEVDIANMDAAVPLDLIGELEYRERQLRKARADNALVEARQKRIDATEALSEKQTELELGLARKTDKLQMWRTMLDSYTIVAEQPGFVIHSIHPWSGSKLQEGDQANSGMQVASVAQNTNMQVVAWVNAVDIPHLAEDSSVSIRFDAVKDVTLEGRINEIALAGDVKPEWGDGLYYRVTVEMQGADALDLLSGMSVLIEIPVRRSA